eukprot:jgi/Ulvmu1/2073/UM123_0005.1
MVEGADLQRNGLRTPPPAPPPAPADSMVDGDGDMGGKPAGGARKPRKPPAGKKNKPNKSYITPRRNPGRSRVTFPSREGGDAGVTAAAGVSARQEDAEGDEDKDDSEAGRSGRAPQSSQATVSDDDFDPGRRSMKAQPPARPPSAMQRKRELEDLPPSVDPRATGGKGTYHRRLARRETQEAGDREAGTALEDDEGDAGEWRDDEQGPGEVCGEQGQASAGEAGKQDEGGSTYAAREGGEAQVDEAKPNEDGGDQGDATA